MAACRLASLSFPSCSGNASAYNAIMRRSALRHRQEHQADGGSRGGILLLESRRRIAVLNKLTQHTDKPSDKKRQSQILTQRRLFLLLLHILLILLRSRFHRPHFLSQVVFPRIKKICVFLAKLPEKRYTQ